MDFNIGGLIRSRNSQFLLVGKKELQHHANSERCGTPGCQILCEKDRGSKEMALTNMLVKVFLCISQG